MGSGVMKNFVRVALVALVSVSTTIACSSGATTSPVATAPSTNTLNISGTVPAPVNGVQQTDSHPFNVGQTGTVTITLTAATETFANGTTLNPAVYVGVAIGSPAGATCTVAAGTTPNSLSAGAGSMNQISGTLNAGAYCVQVSSGDQTSLQGPIVYTIVIVAP
jgi:hypothetical protein